MLHCLTLCEEDSQSASRRLNRREIASISMHNEVRPAAGLEWGCITLLPQMNFSRVHLEPRKPRPPPLGSRTRADLVITAFTRGPKEEENKPPSSSVECRCDSVTKVEKEKDKSQAWQYVILLKYCKPFLFFIYDTEMCTGSCHQCLFLS